MGTLLPLTRLSFGHDQDMIELQKIIQLRSFFVRDRAFVFRLINSVIRSYAFSEGWKQMMDSGVVPEAMKSTNSM